MLLHAASFGLVHLGTMAYLADRLPPTARARGQGTMSIAMGVSMAGSTALAGALYAGIGVKAYFAMAVIALIGWCIAAYARSLPRVATN
jgi:PPP family 3-phenylpropionic acid transporter